MAPPPSPRLRLRAWCHPRLPSHSHPLCCLNLCTEPKPTHFPPHSTTRLHPGPVYQQPPPWSPFSPPCSQRDPVNTGVRSCPSPAQGPPVAPSQVKALCLVAHGTPHNPTGQHAPCRGCRFYQGSGKIPHAARQLSLCTPTGAHMPQSPRSTMKSPHIATRE